MIVASASVNLRIRVEDWGDDVVCVGGCWIWRGPFEDGRPRCTPRLERTDGSTLHEFSTMRADVYSYWLATGRHERDVEQLCGDARCVNPAHLAPSDVRAVTLRDSRARQRRTCKHGHPWRPGSWRWVAGDRRRPKRRCLICLRNERRAKRARKRALFGAAT